MEKGSFSPSDFALHMRAPGAMLQRGGPNLLRDFKEFALRGSMLDLAVGIVIGVAFGRIISSLVDDILMPPIGLLLGHVDSSNLFLSLSGQHYASLAAAKAAGAPTLNYGVFFNTVLNFLIVAFAVFMVVRQVNRLKRQEVAQQPELRPCRYCCSAIPAAAVRCPHCTAVLGEAATAP